MLEFLSANWGTIAVSILVLIMLFAIFSHLRKEKKKGQGCGGGCAHCPNAGICQKQ